MIEFLEVLSKARDQYYDWLTTQSFSPHTVRVYQSRINHFLGYLGMRPHLHPKGLSTVEGRDQLVNAYKEFLETKRTGWTVNGYLVAIDSFYCCIGLGKTTANRAPLEARTICPLSSDEQQRFLKALENANAKDRAIGTLLLKTGLRIGECAALDLDDITLKTHFALLKIGVGRSRKQIVLDDLALDAMRAWLIERKRKVVGNKNERVLFISARRQRITTAGIDFILRKLGRQANLTSVSATTLLHTWYVNRLSTVESSLPSP